MYKRRILTQITQRLREKRRFIQVLSGPRQTGKTTLAEQAARSAGIPYHYASADFSDVPEPLWIQTAWKQARILLDKQKAKPVLLILDEIQKISQWSSVIKAEWDADTRFKRNIQVMILGSAPLLIQHGLTESLAGRFEIIPVRAWSYQEMYEAFHWNLDQYIFYGGYPSTAELISEPERFTTYIRNSLIETTLSRDILLLNTIQKPALLRRLFHLGCEYSGQILSYQKMLGQLHDAGNTTTLAHYLHLLGGAGLMTGIEKYYGKKIMQRGSSPKLLALNNALISANNTLPFEVAKARPEYWGRLIESAVGAHLLNHPSSENQKVYYWRDGNDEVDFIVTAGEALFAIEVKSGRKKPTNGLSEFLAKFPRAQPLVIGTGGISLEDFFTNEVLS
ncbi:MAG: AAA family ATPase [Gammaproteobacteria bacterium RIFCSPHIGHO2_12_FULL_38_14]|nr:MAG: AAA family ATPase [Gammaproteobacteria bacterium RIFCSPHIGHO2_12_FULL_38_14]